MSLDDGDELAYLWSKVKFVQNYMRKNSCSFEAAEKEFHLWIDGLMDSRIERANRMLNEMGGAGRSSNNVGDNAAGSSQSGKS